MAQPPGDDPSEIKEYGAGELGSETRYFIELLDADPHHLAVGDGAHEYPERPTVEERQLTYQCSGGERPERAGSASPSLLADRFQRPLDDQVERPLGVVGLDDRLAGTEPPTAAVIEQERPVVLDAVGEEVLLLLLGPDPLAPRRVVKEGHIPPHAGPPERTSADKSSVAYVGVPVKPCASGQQRPGWAKVASFDRVVTDHVDEGVDEGQVRERLWEVPEVPPAAGVDLLGVQAEGAGVGEQLLAQGLRTGRFADLREGGDQPERADGEGPLFSREAVVGLLHPVAQDHAVEAQLVSHRPHRGPDALVAGRQEAHQR